MKNVLCIMLSVMLLSLSGCGNNHNAVEITSGIDLADTENNAILKDSANEGNDKPVYNYLPGYQDMYLYRILSEVERCNDPEELRVLLSDIYGEEIDYQRIDSSENLNDANGDGSHYGFTVEGLYDIDRSILPVKGDVYVFLRPYYEIPIFIMDNNGAYIVSEYQVNNYDDGTHGHMISAYFLTDLFMCRYMFTECDSEEYQRVLSETVGDFEWYMEFENLAENYAVKNN